MLMTRCDPLLKALLYSVVATQFQPLLLFFLLCFQPLGTLQAFNAGKFSENVPEMASSETSEYEKNGTSYKRMARS